MNWLFFFSLLFSISTAPIHEFHVSKCLIKYDEANASIKVSMHIFLDDLEDALELMGGTNLNLCTSKESPDAEDWMIKYIARQFEVKLNGQSLETYFMGKEISEDLAAVWCYLEIEDVKPSGEIEIRNEILLDLFDDQKNIISVKLPGSSEYLLFQKGESSEKLSF